MQKVNNQLLEFLAGPLILALLLLLVWSERFWSVDAIFQKHFDQAESILARLDRHQSIQDANPHLNGSYYIYHKFDKEDRSGGNLLVMSNNRGRDGLLLFPKPVLTTSDENRVFQTARYIVIRESQYSDYRDELHQMYSFDPLDSTKETKVGKPYIAPTYHTVTDTFEIYEIASGKLVAKKTSTRSETQSRAWFASLGLDVPW